MSRADASENDLSIETRGGLPDEWLFLLRDYPRDVWMGHDNLGEHTKFWLQIHRHFRLMGAHLTGQTATYREGDVSAETFRAAMAPRLQQFLSTLDHHHRIEDHLFFPKFMAAEKRLVKGIELLGADHTIIDAEVQNMVNVANALLRTAESDKDGLKRQGEAFADSADRIVALLHRHLDDEEEIVIPLLLDRGEETLMPE